MTTLIEAGLQPFSLSMAPVTTPGPSRSSSGVDANRRIDIGLDAVNRTWYGKLLAIKHRDARLYMDIDNDSKKFKLVQAGASMTRGEQSGI